MHKPSLSCRSHCNLVQGGVKELGSKTVRKWKKATAGHSWVSHGHHSAARTKTLSDTSSHGHWRKCGGESWGAREAEHCIPGHWGWQSHSVIGPSVIYRLQSWGLGRSCTGRLQPRRLLHTWSLCSRIISYHCTVLYCF